MLGLRTATRASQALPAFRNTAARRWASSGAEFKGAADNAFNRERAAVKQHAADTSGKWREKRGEREGRVVLV
jgi:cytochrome c oxidase subunit 6a